MPKKQGISRLSTYSLKNVLFYIYKHELQDTAQHNAEQSLAVSQEDTRVSLYWFFFTRGVDLVPPLGRTSLSTASLHKHHR